MKQASQRLVVAVIRLQPRPELSSLQVVILGVPIQSFTQNWMVFESEAHVRLD
jgi:hypothetical protein